MIEKTSLTGTPRRPLRLDWNHGWPVILAV